MENKKQTLMILCTVPDERAEMVLYECSKRDIRSVFVAEVFHEETANAADCFYTADWNDSDALLRIARNEKITGITGLCDKAMVPAAKVSVTMGLPGNTPECIEMFLSKNSFRLLQENAGAFCPKHFVTGSAEGIRERISEFRFPLIVKPLLCSSSFGMTTLYDTEGLEEAFAKASKASRNGQVCVEEFIENDSLRIVETDVFVVEDDILWDGIRFCYRLPEAPLRPVYDVYPADLADDELREIKTSVKAVLRTAGVRLGEFNVEGFFTPEGRFFIVEINPRQAGHYNPQDIELYCGVSLTRLLITTSCGDLSYYEELGNFHRERNNIFSYSVFAFREGILKDIYIDPGIKSCLKVMRFLHGQKPGDHVCDILHAVRPICKTVFEFETAGELEKARKQIRDLVYPVLK